MSRHPATIAIPGYRVGNWKAPLGCSDVTFAIRLLAVGKVRGRFTGCAVALVTHQDPFGSAVTATIDTASIDTGNDKRDGHLRSADYLDVETYPTMSYRSTAVLRIADRWIVDGDLTLRGVTRRVPLAVEVIGFGQGRQADFSATAQIDRRDFGIDVPLDGGGAVVGRTVLISLQVRAVLKEAP
ncbi:YceI family protein [Mycobacterium syngnathidarum]